MRAQKKNTALHIPHMLEQQFIKQLGLSVNRFHRVHTNQWKPIYYKITEQFADKTKIWKNGLHWANTNGYSPKSMKKLIGCYQTDYQTWFFKLPEIIQENESMVYFLLDLGGDWYFGEHFLLFEGYIPELVQVLSLLNRTRFLGFGLCDYYIVSKKYQWIIGYNHHDIASFVGEGLNPNCLKLK